MKQSDIQAVLFFGAMTFSGFTASTPVFNKWSWGGSSKSSTPSNTVGSSSTSKTPGISSNPGTSSASDSSAPASSSQKKLLLSPDTLKRIEAKGLTVKEVIVEEPKCEGPQRLACASCVCDQGRLAVCYQPGRRGKFERRGVRPRIANNYCSAGCTCRPKEDTIKAIQSV